VNAAGSALALHMLGFQDVFDTIVGISTGAAIGAYFLSGGDRPLMGAPVYYEECTTEEFSNLAYFRPYVDIDYIEGVMKERKKKIDSAHIRASRSKFYVGVMGVPGGRGSFINAKTAKPSLLRAVKASMAMYGLYNIISRSR
jgi:predicted patatin/cPLA2 family phospholipase